MESGYRKLDLHLFVWKGVEALRVKCCEECGFRKSVLWDDYYKSFLCDFCAFTLRDKEDNDD